MSETKTMQNENTRRPRMDVEVAGLKFRNPVMPASGTFGYGEEYAPYLDLNQLGAVVTKGLSLIDATWAHDPSRCGTRFGLGHSRIPTTGICSRVSSPESPDTATP